MGGPHSRGLPGSREGVPEARYGFIRLLPDHCVSLLKPTGDPGESQTLPTPTQLLGQPRLSRSLVPSLGLQTALLAAQAEITLGVQVAVWTAAAPASPGPSAVPGGPEHSPEALAASAPTHPDVLLPDLPTRGGAQRLLENRRSPLLTPGGPGLSVPWGSSVPSVASQVSILRTT